MIRSFACKETAKIFDEETSKKLPREIQIKALQRLLYIDVATRIEDLFQPTSNRFHKLTGNLSEYFSISINHQWRIIFQFRDGDAYDVKIIDYH